MSSIDVVDAQGAKTGTAELPAELFDVAANIPLIHQVVVAQLAAARQGTASTKRRGEVRGGGRKPHRQKGTGRARQGSTRAPQYVGGGVVHGPHPRDYAQRTPKKMIAAALRGALSDRARDGRVYVVADLVAGEKPSTKTALAAIARVSTTDKVLVVIHRDEDLAWLSLRNAAGVHAIAADQLNAYDVLVNDEVVFTASALDAYVAGRVGGKSVKAVASESEVDFDEPSNAELAATSVEGSAEPTNEQLAATLTVVGEPVEAFPEPVETVNAPVPPVETTAGPVEPVQTIDDAVEPVQTVDVIEPVDPVAELADEIDELPEVQSEADPREGADDK